MKTLKIFTFLSYFLLSFAVLGQNYTAHTQESILDLLGRTQYSPKVIQFASDFKLNKVSSIWASSPVTLYVSSSTSKEDIVIVESIRFDITRAKELKIPFFEKGFWGITAGMKRSKVDEILNGFNPKLEFDSKTNSSFINNSDHVVSVYFDGDKKNSKTRFIIVSLHEDKLAKYLQKDFDEFGAKVLLPPDVFDLWSSNKNDPNFINVIPNPETENCFTSNNKIGTITFPNVKTFEGIFNHFLGSEGKLYFYEGELSYSLELPSTVYKGSFIHGLADGDALVSLKNNGKAFRSKWKNGFVYHVDSFDLGGNFYSGEVSKDFHMEGKGKIFHDVYSCIGTFKNNTIISDRNYTIKDGQNEYRGQINQDFQPEGEGSYKLSNGNQIFGSFIDGQFQGGTGTIHLANGTIYKGKLNSQSLPQGQGTYTYTNGNYTSCITNGDVYTNAKGKIAYQDGTVYTGELNEKFEPFGTGRIEGEDGVYIDGEFDNTGFLGGKGYLKYGDGSSYKGEIDKNRTPHGSGTFTYANGNGYITATFKNGTMLPGQGYRKYADGASFNGILDSQGNANGHGTVYNGKGTYYTGYFKGPRLIGSVLIKENNGKAYEGPADEKFMPHGRGKYKNSKNDSWHSANFYHGKIQ